MRAREFLLENNNDDLNRIIEDFLESDIGKKHRQHDCKTVTRAFVNWANEKKIPTKVILLAPPSDEFVENNPQFKDREGKGHIIPIVYDHAVDFTARQFKSENTYKNPLITPVRDIQSVYGKFGYFTDKPKWFLDGTTSFWMGPLNEIPPEIFDQTFEDEILKEDLRKWFKEKWVRFGPDGKIRGSCARGNKKEGKPKCLPRSKAYALGKKGRASAAARKRRQDPNPERKGKARNVKTK